MRNWGWLFAALVFSAACTKPNPAKHCTDGTCTTPNYPFCDVTGAIGGEEGTCIAVTCTAGEFGECRGDAEVRCNATGNNYDVVQCERGCDAAADGCRLCSPNETACTNGKVATCDATGAVTSMTDCPLGCFEDEPRCREIDPSNDLAAYLDMVSDPPDIDLEDATINTNTGVITDVGGITVDVPNFLVYPPIGGVPVRVFVANKVRIGRASTQGVFYEFTGPALAIVARDEIRVTGELHALGAAGGVLLAGCTGGRGLIRSACTYASSGGGGGGFATDGAKGGDVTNNSEPGGAAGIASGSERLVPLRGGCAGGSVNNESGQPADLEYGGPGGGAIQLSSRTNIVIDGIIDVSGAEGGGEDHYDQTAGYLIFGGGAGGGILLEAPAVTLDVNARLSAGGGVGGGDTGAGCPANTSCSMAGSGARPGTPATAGADIACTPSTQMTAFSGGGGGGLGRVRVNTATGTYTKASSAVEVASVTTGTVATR